MSKKAILVKKAFLVSVMPRSEVEEEKDLNWEENNSPTEKVKKDSALETQKFAR